MDEGFSVNIELVGDKVRLKAMSELQPEHPVMFDYVPPLGDGDGFLGLEMLLMSFAACVSTAIAAQLRRTGKSFSYRMRATGYRREQPLSLEKIGFQVFVTSEELTDGEMESILKTAEAISPVWLAVKGNVEVAPTYRIERT